MTSIALAGYIACFAVCLPALGQQAERVALVATHAPKTSYYVQEELHLELRFGFEQRFRESALIQLFQRELDLPVQLIAPWIGDLPGALAVGSGPAPEPSLPGTSLVLNEQRTRAHSTLPHPGEPPGFQMYAIARRYLPDRAGTLRIPAPAMRFAHATRFREDLLNGRVADDRIETTVRGTALELQILPLPEAGRPDGFSGAVGNFSLRVQADERDLSAGQSLKLELRIEGRGNFETLHPPRLDRLEGFYVNGVVEQRGSDHRTAIYDIVPRGERVKHVPAIAFSYFDPNPPAGYRTVASRPIPILVRPTPAAPGQEPSTHDELSASAPDSAPSGSRLELVWALGSGAFLVCTALALLLRKRRAHA